MPAPREFGWQLLVRFPPPSSSGVLSSGGTGSCKGKGKRRERGNSFYLLTCAKKQLLLDRRSFIFRHPKFEVLGIRPRGNLLFGVGVSRGRYTGFVPPGFNALPLLKRGMGKGRGVEREELAFEQPPLLLSSGGETGPLHSSNAKERKGKVLAEHLAPMAGQGRETGQDGLLGPRCGTWQQEIEASPHFSSPCSTRKIWWHSSGIGCVGKHIFSFTFLGPCPEQTTTINRGRGGRPFPSAALGKEPLLGFSPLSSSLTIGHCCY